MTHEAKEKTSTDWKEEVRILLEKGTRNSIGNAPDDHPRKIAGRSLFLMEEGAKRRKARRKKRPEEKTYRERLHGLFGSEEP